MSEQGKMADINQLMATEWVLPNRTGGYASGTLSGVNTRKYHGLLIGGFEPDGRRHYFVGGLEETLTLPGHSYTVSTHKYSPDALFPMGYRHLQAWEISDYTVTTVYGEFGDLDLELSKEIRVYPSVDGVGVHYSIKGRKRPFKLNVSPLITYRDIHTVRTSAPYHSERGDGWQSPDQFEFGPEIWSVNGQKYGMIAVTAAGSSKSLYMISTTSDYARLDEWYHNFQYDLEMERGYEAIEDLFCPGSFRSTLGERQFSLFFLLASTPAEAKKALRKALKAEQTPTVLLSSGSEPVDKDVWRIRLEAQMQQFIIQDNKGNLKGLVAGYPWFGMWSRDTLISLPGLLRLADGPQSVKKLLQSHFDALLDGQVSNILEEHPRRYDFVADSPLLLVLALYAYIEHTGDAKFLKTVWPQCLSIARRCLRGSEAGSQYCDSEGILFFVADGQRAATWMDAIVAGQAVTPRYGAPVEIQALWYNVVSALVYWEGKYDLDSSSLQAPLGSVHKQDLSELGASIRMAIADRYFQSDLGYYADYLAADGAPNRQLRPNQLFLSGLPFACIDQDRAKQMSSVVEEKLLTPAGLRTLSPDDAEYHRVYQGSQARRDGAYHQGTVWPWLLGAYGRTLFYVENQDVATNKLVTYLAKLFAHLEVEHKAYWSEIYSAEDLASCGTMHQAWNVAEILALLYLVGAPSYKKEKE